MENGHIPMEHMPEDGHTIYSHATYEAFEEYGEDFKILAKNVADLLAQKKWPFQLTTKCFGFLETPKIFRSRYQSN